MLKLTQTVQKGGCAAKVAATELRKILSGVKFPVKGPDILVDGSHFDDAAVHRINEHIALVQTMDFFTPIIDTPYLFGKVAAANALSDVYAMGGNPRTAMAILAYPVSQFEPQVIKDVLQGACDVLADADVSLVGGHSIDDDTLKFGLSVSGFVHPDRIWSNRGAKVNDLLILTKALGTGTLTAALKRSAVSESEIMDAIDSMVLLNRVPDFLGESLSAFVHAATDITGFGLLGHAKHIAEASHKTLHIEFARLPIFGRAREFLSQGYLTKAHRTNAEYTESAVKISDTVTDLEKQILFDPQTSGGLLLSVDAARAEDMLLRLKNHFPDSTIIGTVSAAGPNAIEVV